MKASLNSTLWETVFCFADDFAGTSQLQDVYKSEYSHCILTFCHLPTLLFAWVSHRVTDCAVQRPAQSVRCYTSPRLRPSRICGGRSDTGRHYFRVLRFLSTFSKLRKAAICFVMSVCLCLSVRMEQLCSHWTDFRDILQLSIFENLLRKFNFH